MRRLDSKTLAGLRASPRWLPIRQSLSSPLSLSLHRHPSQHSTSSYHHSSCPSSSSSSSFSPRPAFTALSSSSSSQRPRLPSSPRSPLLLRQTRPMSGVSALAPVLDSAVTLAQSTLQLYHALPLPWYLAIPLFAGTLSLVTRLPTTVYARRIAIRRTMLAPLARAWAVRIKEETEEVLIRRRSAATAAVAAAAAAKGAGGDEDAGGEIAEKALGFETQSERNKRWGVQAWKDWVPSLTVFPVWLVGIEGVRRMCGGPRGWLGALIFGATGGDEGAAAAAAVAAASSSSSSAVAAASSSSGLYVADASMTTGGCLWFTDLTAADPYHVLPFALSAILVLNVVPKSKQMWEVLLATGTGSDQMPSPTDWRVRLQRGLLVVALAVGPVTMDLPAALHLYWIASASLSWVQTNLIWRAMPLPKMPPPATKELDYILPEREPASAPAKGPSTKGP
ncbi:hypothetical protein VTJ83DRAFT_6841 [Remersonia thermophila]|uniref:Uncharacterized protein n=1 Tax=Remersonia thermophila TaxID=72144 RepID=A0ABR4D5U5_9PEZI